MQLQADTNVTHEHKALLQEMTCEDIVQMGGILHEQRFHLVDEQNFQTGERIGSVAAAHTRVTAAARWHDVASPAAVGLAQHQLQAERRRHNDVRRLKWRKKLDILAIDADTHPEAVVGVARHELHEIIRSFGNALCDSDSIILWAHECSNHINDNFLRKRDQNGGRCNQRDSNSFHSSRCMLCNKRRKKC